MSEFKSARLPLYLGCTILSYPIYLLNLRLRWKRMEKGDSVNFYK